MRSAFALFALLAVGTTGASAQELLSGQYQCVQNCTGPQMVYITQNGWDMIWSTKPVSHRGPGSIIPDISGLSAGTKAR